MIIIIIIVIIIVILVIIININTIGKRWEKLWTNLAKVVVEKWWSARDL